MLLREKISGPTWKPLSFKLYDSHVAVKAGDLAVPYSVIHGRAHSAPRPDQR